jgi:sulfate adenylyltransferase subunit 2
MNARTETQLLEAAAALAAQPTHTHHLSNAHLDALEEETIFILREVAASFERPALLFSGGKDSLVMLKCAEKAFGAGRIPYPLLMIDTGHNFVEVTDFRDSRAKELNAELIVRSVEDSMARGTVRLAHPGESRNVHQSVTLLEAIEEFRFDALIGGARRDEEKARAKERIFSHRDSFGQWQPKAQRPELWTLFNTRLAPGEHFRVFPDQQLDRAGRLAVHRARADRPALDLLHPPARGGGPPRPAGASDRPHPAEGRRNRADPRCAFSHRGRHHLHLPGGKPGGHAG